MRKVSIIDMIDTCKHLSIISFLSIIYYIVLHVLKVSNIQLMPLFILMLLSIVAFAYFTYRYTVVDHMDAKDVFKYLSIRSFRSIELKQKHARSVVISLIISYFYMLIFCKVVNEVITVLLILALLQYLLLVQSQNKRERKD